MSRSPSEAELLAALTEVFRRHGFEGATLALISQATDLQKSSLYYRFPGGKEQMARMVLAAVQQQLAEHVLEPLRREGPPRQRVEEMAMRLGEYFAGGTKACVLDTLSVGTVGQASGSEPGSIAADLRSAYLAFQQALAEVARRAGKTDPQAEQAATRALVQIEGSLVVSRLSGDPKVFAQVLSELPDLLCD